MAYHRPYFEATVFYRRCCFISSRLVSLLCSSVVKFALFVLLFDTLPFHKSLHVLDVLKHNFLPFSSKSRARNQNFLSRNLCSRQWSFLAYFNVGLVRLAPWLSEAHNYCERWESLDKAARNVLPPISYRRAGGLLCSESVTPAHVYDHDHFRSISPPPCRLQLCM